MFDVIRATVGAFSQIRLGPWQDLDDTLLVGEGNLSFAKNLLRQPGTYITQMMATTYESENGLSDETRQNAVLLRHRGILVMHSVDATHLERSIRPHKFDTIIFQFPNVGSREAIYGRNPNFIMIRKFLRSAVPYLAPSGRVLISVVDNPHYQGAFQFNEAAVFAGYAQPEVYLFDPSLFSGYSHTNTNDDESALDDHNRFSTWIFRLKK